MDLLERYKGSLLGLAIGDALGTTLEFRSPGTFEPIVEMNGGGPFNLPIGFWTDDTSMALCLAESLIQSAGFDPQDQMHRYLRWYREGHLSSTGTCFDIGNTVRQALERFEATGKPYSGSTDSRTAGNGSLMRLAPVILFFGNRPREAIYMAGESSKTTHGAQEAVDACRYLAALLYGALHGESKQDLLAPDYTPVEDVWKEAPLCKTIAELATGTYKLKKPPHIKGSGYVVKSLEAALWCFANSTDFKEGALLAANLGDDADTTAAIYGQLAGAYYGKAGIPLSWRSKLFRSDFIESLAEQLYQLARTNLRNLT